MKKILQPIFGNIIIEILKIELTLGNETHILDDHLILRLEDDSILKLDYASDNISCDSLKGLHEFTSIAGFEGATAKFLSEGKVQNKGVVQTASTYVIEESDYIFACKFSNPDDDFIWGVSFGFDEIDAVFDEEVFEKIVNGQGDVTVNRQKIVKEK